MHCVAWLQLAQQTKLRDAVRADLFPTADMIVSMSREFGVPLTAEDFEGEKRFERISAWIGLSAMNSVWSENPCMSGSVCSLLTSDFFLFCFICCSCFVFIVFPLSFIVKWHSL